MIMSLVLLSLAHSLLYVCNGATSPVSVSLCVGGGGGVAKNYSLCSSTRSSTFFPSPVRDSDHHITNTSSLLPGSSLTFSQPVFNGTTLLGVLHGILPFTKLISSLLTILDQRPLSYAFVLGPGRVPLYHPLLPGDTKAIVSIASLEPEEELEPLLDR